MRTDSRLSRVLHVLMHMARSDGPITSERMAEMLGTNPVVVRRMMAAVREAGCVRAEKGRGGGWTLACDLGTTTLRDVYRAVGSPTLFAIGGDGSSSSCPVERAVNGALGDALRSAEELLLARLGRVTLADLAAAFEQARRSTWRSDHAKRVLGTAILGRREDLVGAGQCSAREDRSRPHAGTRARHR